MVFVQEKWFPVPTTTGLLSFTYSLCEQALQHSPGFTYRASDAADEVCDFAESLRTKLRGFCSAAEMRLTAETAGTCFFPVPRHQTSSCKPSRILNSAKDTAIFSLLKYNCSSFRSCPLKQRNVARSHSKL